MKSTEAPVERLVSVEEVAERLGIKVHTLYLWRTKGKGPRAVRVGKYLRYRWMDVLAWEESQMDLSVA
ncbi:helix-turn-helix domain-containing protein [Arthrobacter silviterrae]|uniref:Helix-turn-helix domain-containing protein n=1 Tax=Arthrobacter silviterrae TaxID=2026658 RepID=A0ABX0D8Z5_9MICC|nr:helix-turn-helix domain-containing protein [Arthrobacter silviterrae]